MPFFFFFLSFFLSSLRLSFKHRNFSTKLMLITAQSFTTTQRLHSFKFTLINKSHSQHTEAAVCCLGRHFSNCVHMCTQSLIPRPKTTVIGLEARLVHKRNRQWAVCMAVTVFSSHRHWARLMNTTSETCVTNEIHALRRLHPLSWSSVYVTKCLVDISILLSNRTVR